MRVVIIEDETAAAYNLKSILSKVEESCEVVATIESITKSVEWLEANPDGAEILFMDIHLADGDAFNIFKSVEVNIPIIFTTAYDMYALKAFEVSSIDYLLKPIKEADLKRALDKYRMLTEIDRGEYSANVRNVMRQRLESHTFLMSVRDRIVPIKSSDIAFCYTTNEKVTITTITGESYPYDKALDHIVTLLPEDNFFRANRQFVVARGVISDMVVWFGNRLCLNLIMDTPEKIIISKARVKLFKQWMSQIK